MHDAAGTIEARILASPKYQWLCPSTVRRVVCWGMTRWSRPADVEKHAKRKLHQVYGAYLGQWREDKAQLLADELGRAEDSQQCRSTCQKILSLHASTRERLPILDAFYHQLLDGVAPGARILDIGCGLNPFSMPWMQRIPDIQYVGWEIDRRIVSLVNTASDMLGWPVRAELRDILVAPPTAPFDMIWLLKMLPCLLQQDPNCHETLLQQLPAQTLVFSFPVRSLGGRCKKMRSNYADIMEKLLAGHGRTVVRTDYADELTFVVTKN
jgi:16S rRNA (guanine(1405)-N(7))-methyltransferase